MIAKTTLEMDYVKFAQVKGAVRLEKAGMKSRGGSVRLAACKAWGLPRNTSHDDLIVIIEGKMNELLELIAKERQAEIGAPCGLH